MAEGVVGCGQGIRFGEQLRAARKAQRTDFRWEAGPQPRGKGRDVIAACIIQSGFIPEASGFSVSAHHAHRRDRRVRDRRSRPDVRHDLRVRDHGRHRDVRRGHHDQLHGPVDRRQRETPHRD